MMRNIRTWIHRGLSLLMLVAVSACSSESDDDSFPTMFSEMGVLKVGASTSTLQWCADNGKTFRVTTEISNLKPNVWLRCFCDYVLADDNTVDIKSIRGVYVLPNCSKKTIIKQDPVGVVSAWTGGGFINMHLLKKTQGADHEWGFVIDNTYSNNAGGTTYEVSLYHDQSGDPTAYSSDIFFSLNQDSLSMTRSAADSITLSITTFESKPYIWHFGLAQ